MKSSITYPSIKSDVPVIRKHHFTNDVAVWSADHTSYTILVTGGKRKKFGTNGLSDGPPVGTVVEVPYTALDRISANWIPVPEGTVITIEV